MLWLGLKDYQHLRLLTLFQPQNDLLGAGYHSWQSKIAIGSGGLWGKGLFAGTKSRLHFLPETPTDFIFAVLVEAMGFWGGLTAFCVIRNTVATRSRGGGPGPRPPGLSDRHRGGRDARGSSVSQCRYDDRSHPHHRAPLATDELRRLFTDHYLHMPRIADERAAALFYIFLRDSPAKLTTSASPPSRTR